MSRPNRQITNRYMRHILQAIEEEMGRQSLRMVLRQAGLERYVSSLPPLNDQQVAYASELASLEQAIRTYYGRGSRGSLNRIGSAIWRSLIEEAPLMVKVRLFSMRLRPPRERWQAVLSILAQEMRGQKGRVSVGLQDEEIIFVDGEGDFAFGRHDETHICWITQGMIQEALVWAGLQDTEVEETGCRGRGAPECRFRVRIG
jgi:predicted hydrocarbon binding protein